MKTENFDFEAAMARLEEIVKLLESGQSSLNDSIKLYEEGVALVSKANTLLSEAKQKLITASGEVAVDE